MRRKKIAIGGYYSDGGGRTREDFFIILMFLGCNYSHLWKARPWSEPGEKWKAEIGFERLNSHYMWDCSGKGSGEGNLHALEVGKESYACCQVAKCAMLPSDWKGSIWVKQEVVKDPESELYSNGLSLNYKTLAIYTLVRYSAID